jgi:nitrogenase molybdenum-iron protein beta chain
VVESVVKKQESRFYNYLTDIVDFFAEYRSNIPTELFTIADSAYGIGLSSFLINEMGFNLKGLYVTDDPSKENCNLICKIAESTNDIFKDKVFFQVDGGLIQEDIREKIGEPSKTLFLGSSWEKILAQETNNLVTFISLPLAETMIINKTFLGYDGGLNFVEEIFSDLFKTKVTVTRNILTSEVETKLKEQTVAKNNG